MSDDNHTHVLSIKIVDPSNNLIYNNELLETVKENLINKDIQQELYIFSKLKPYNMIWKKIEFKNEYDFFGFDLFTNSEYESDVINHVHTQTTIKEIEKNIKKTGLYGDNWKIIFQLFRTLYNIKITDHFNI